LSSISVFGFYRRSGDFRLGSEDPSKYVVYSIFSIKSKTSLSNHKKRENQLLPISLLPQFY